jgi:hypothetical protein
MLFPPRAPPEIFVRKLPRERTVGVHLYVQAKEGNIEIQTRMFAPSTESPKTRRPSMLGSVPGQHPNTRLGTGCPILPRADIVRDSSPLVKLRHSA